MAVDVPITIFHVGLPLDHPAIPVAERPKVALRLAALHETMRAAGYRYEIVPIDPEVGLEGFRDRLRREGCDGVLIGGGVVSDPAMADFMGRIVDAVHEAVPGARVMLHDHSVAVKEMVGRWFPVG